MITKLWKRICCQIRNPIVAVVILCIYGLVYGMTSSLTTAMLRTLEKRFDLTTAEVSWLLSANDIGYIASILFVAYYGGKGNHVKCLVMSAIGFGLSGYVAASPYFFFGNRYSPEELLGSSKPNETSSSFESLTLKAACDAGSGRRNNSAILTTSHIPGQKSAAIALEMIAGILSGVAASPFWNVGISLIDDIMGKKSGAFLGCLFAIRALAPIFGFLFASFLNSVNESLKFLVTSFPGGEKDPFWIGAWWSGYFFLGTCTLLTAPFLALFDGKAMIERAKETDFEKLEEDKQGSVNDSKTDPENDGENEPQKEMSFQDLFNVVKSFGTNPIFTLFLTGRVIQTFGFLCMTSFLQRFFEYHFRMTPSQSNMAFSIVLPGAAVVAFVISGLISVKFPMSRKGNNFFYMITSIIATLLFPLLFLFVCPNTPIVGSDNKSPVFDCSPKNCSCPNTYRPICVDNQDYYSACQAGCDSFNASTSMYMNCLCKNATATLGVCEGLCDVTFWYCAVLFIINVVEFVPSVQGTQLMLSLGNEETKAFGMGALGFFNGIIGFIVPPIGGQLISDMCLVRNPSATGNSFCVLYDANLMRVMLHLLFIGPKIVSCVFYVLSWYKTPQEGTADQNREAIDTVKRTEFVNQAFENTDTDVTKL